MKKLLVAILLLGGVAHADSENIISVSIGGGVTDETNIVTPGSTTTTRKHHRSTTVTTPAVVNLTEVTKPVVGLMYQRAQGRIVGGVLIQSNQTLSVLMGVRF